MKWLSAAAMILLAAHGATAQCIITALPVTFGVYQPFSAKPVDGNGSIAIRCHAFGPYSIAINSSVTGRHMSRAGSQLSYQLYIDAARRTVWGDGTGGSAIVSGFCTGSCNNDHAVYGRIPPRQSVTPGTYMDSITVMVVF